MVLIVDQLTNYQINLFRMMSNIEKNLTILTIIMIDYAIWNRDRKCIDSYVYGFAASTKSVTSYANSLYMRRAMGSF